MAGTSEGELSANSSEDVCPRMMASEDHTARAIVSVVIMLVIVLMVMIRTVMMVIVIIVVMMIIGIR